MVVKELPTDKYIKDLYGDIPVYIHTTIEDRLCNKCGGMGFIEWEEVTNYHDYQTETHKKPCTLCDEQGLLQVTTKESCIRFIPRTYEKIEPKYRKTK